MSLTFMMSLYKKAPAVIRSSINSRDRQRQVEPFRPPVLGLARLTATRRGKEEGPGSAAISLAEQDVD